MPTPQIADPVAWSKQNGYELKSQDDKFTTVCYHGNAVGVLTKVGDYFEFKQLDAPTDKSLFGQKPAKIYPESDVVRGHPDPNTTYLKPGNYGDYPLVNSESSDESSFYANPTVTRGYNPLELSSLSKSCNEIDLGAGVSGTGQSERILDCNIWLPYAAERYQLSRDIRDYVLVPIPGIFSSLPNTNGDSLSLAEMLTFKPDFGMQMYKTFKGQPTHIEHQNKDITKAKGVILESFLRPVPFNKRYYKIVMLLAWDRTKDPALVNQILTKQRNCYSVGFYYSSYSCSICGKVVGRKVNLDPCSHTRMLLPTYKADDGRLVYRHCHDAKGFECSSVNSPAFVSAIGNTILDPRQY